MVEKRVDGFTSAPALPVTRSRHALIAIDAAAILLLMAGVLTATSALGGRSQWLRLAGAAASSGTSVDEAQKLVDFSIVEPTSLPAGVTGQAPTATTYRVGTSSSDRANYVTLVYPINQASQQQGIFVVETTDSDVVPSINGNSASLPSPLSPDGASQTMPIVRGTETQMGIDGVVVTSFVVAKDSARQTYFVWKHRGVSSYIEAADSTGVTEDELQQMVPTMISRRTSPPLLPPDLVAFVLSLLGGIVLAAVLVAIYRTRWTMLWARGVFAIVPLFSVFLLVDGIVTGPYFVDIGRLLGAGLVLSGMLLYGRWLKPTWNERQGGTAHE